MRALHEGVHGDAVLRLVAAVGGSAARGMDGEPQAGAAPDAVDGHGGSMPAAAIESGASGPPGCIRTRCARS